MSRLLSVYRQPHVNQVLALFRINPSPSPLLSVTEEDGVQVVQLHCPRLNVRSAARFLREISDVLAPGERIALSLSEVHQVDSAGLGAMMAMVKKAATCGASIHVCDVRPSVRLIFELVGLHTVVDILNSATESRLSVKESR